MVLFYAPRKRSKPMRALMAPSQPRSAFGSLAPSYRAFLVVTVTTPNQTSFRLLLRVSPDFAAAAWVRGGRHFAFSFRRSADTAHRYKHHGVSFDDKLDARPSGVSIVRLCVSCTPCATSVSKCAHEHNEGALIAGDSHQK